MKSSGLEKHFNQLYPKIASTHYQAVAIALVRRIVSGVFSSVETPAAYSYCFENTFDPKNYWRINDRRISPDQYCDIALEFCSSGRVVEIVREFRSDPPDDDDDYERRMKPLHDESFRLFLKAGLITRSSVAWLPLYLDRENMGACTREKALRFARASTAISRVEGMLRDTNGEYL